MTIKVTLDAPALTALLATHPDAFAEVERKLIEQVAEATSRRLSKDYINTRIENAINTVIGGTDYRGQVKSSDALRNRVKSIVNDALYQELREVLAKEMHGVAQQLVTDYAINAIDRAVAEASIKLQEQATQTAMKALTEHLRALSGTKP